MLDILIAYSDNEFQKKKDKVYVSYRFNKLIEAINQYVCAALAHTLIFNVNNQVLFKNVY